MKRFIAIVVASGALAGAGAALAPVAFADPNANANCTAQEQAANGDISFFAQLPHPGEPSIVGQASSSDCGQR